MVKRVIFARQNLAAVYAINAGFFHNRLPQFALFLQLPAALFGGNFIYNRGNIRIARL